MMLADMGADVIWVGRPAAAALPPGASDATKAVFDILITVGQGLNRNKRSIVLNLTSESARKVFYQLVQNVDVVLEGFRPGVVKRLKVDYETLKEINPRLIYCSLSGYGQDGPYSQFPGHDINYLSTAGLLSTIGPHNGPPSIPMNYIADWGGAALHGALGILEAVLAREQTGRGQFIDISYTDTAVSFLRLITEEHFNFGEKCRRGEHMLNGGKCFYNVYETKGGEYISIGCIEPHFWENLCREIGREDFIPYQFDEGKQGEMTAALREIFLTKTREEWYDLLKDKNICIGKVYNLGENFDDPQLRHREMLVDVDDPVRGKTKQVGIPIKLSDTPGKIRSAAPLPGQHTEEILTDLGYSKQQIDELLKEGAISVDAG
jgi:crotonobetainyl-CoA:carnitine CoA-transferase CaiB-like acyl-CoA transferase